MATADSVFSWLKAILKDTRSSLTEEKAIISKLDTLIQEQRQMAATFKELKDGIVALGDSLSGLFAAVESVAAAHAAGDDAALAEAIGELSSLKATVEAEHAKLVPPAA